MMIKHCIAILLLVVPLCVQSQCPVNGQNLNESDVYAFQNSEISLVFGYIPRNDLCPDCQVNIKITFTRQDGSFIASTEEVVTREQTYYKLEKDSLLGSKVFGNEGTVVSTEFFFCQTGLTLPNFIIRRDWTSNFCEKSTSNTFLPSGKDSRVNSPKTEDFYYVRMSKNEVAVGYYPQVSCPLCEVSFIIYINDGKGQTEVLAGELNEVYHRATVTVSDDLLYSGATTYAKFFYVSRIGSELCESVTGAFNKGFQLTPYFTPTTCEYPYHATSFAQGSDYATPNPYGKYFAITDQKGNQFTVLASTSHNCFTYGIIGGNTLQGAFTSLWEIYFADLGRSNVTIMFNLTSAQMEIYYSLSGWFKFICPKKEIMCESVNVAWTPIRKINKLPPSPTTTTKPPTATQTMKSSTTSKLSTATQTVKPSTTSKLSTATQTVKPSTTTTTTSSSTARTTVTTLKPTIDTAKMAVIDSTVKKLA